MKILNYGSLNLDHFYKVEYLVKEGETIKSSNYSKLLGGKGLNQSIALKKAGADVYHAGKIGCDGSLLRNTLQELSINTDYLVSDNDTVSGHAIIQVDEQGKNSIIIHGGANQEIRKDEIMKTLDKFSKGDYILLQNEINHVPFIIREAKKRDMTVVFNPAPINEEVKSYPLELVDILILNEVEGKHLSLSSTDEDIINSINEKYQNNITIVTLGENGSILMHKNNLIKQEVVKAEKVLDTTAAGDTFIGYFVATYARTKRLKDSLEIASRASSKCVSRLGSSISIPTLDEV